MCGCSTVHITHVLREKEFNSNHRNSNISPGIQSRHRHSNISPGIQTIGGMVCAKSFQLFFWDSIRNPYRYRNRWWPTYLCRFWTYPHAISPRHHRSSQKQLNQIRRPRINVCVCVELNREWGEGGHIFSMLASPYWTLPTVYLRAPNRRNEKRKYRGWKFSVRGS